MTNVELIQLLESDINVLFVLISMFAKNAKQRALMIIPFWKLRRLNILPWKYLLSLMMKINHWSSMAKKFLCLGSLKDYHCYLVYLVDKEDLNNASKLSRDAEDTSKSLLNNSKNKWTKKLKKNKNKKSKRKSKNQLLNLKRNKLSTNL